MVKEIIRDPIFLKIKSDPATKNDRQIVTDLLDTLKANSDICVGMAANMIGERKCILAAVNGKDFLIMINPVIVDKSKQFYETEEGCLSLDGVRKTKRYVSITV